MSRLLGILTIVGMGWWGLQGIAAAETVAFRFEPPDGTRYVETVRVSRTRSGGGPGVTTDAVEWRRRIEIARTPEGYAVTAMPLSGSRMRDGQSVEDPALAAWLQTTLIYDLDAEGRLLRVQGCEGFAGRLHQSLVPTVAEAVAASITPEALAAQETAAWNERIGWLVGRSAAIGEVVSETAALPLPDGGSAVYDVTIMPLEPVVSGTRQGVRVQVLYSAQAGPALAPAAEAIALVTDLLATGRSAVITGIYLSGSVERVVDPATLLPIEETATRLVTLPIEAPEGGRTTITFDEQLRYTFEYE